MALTGNIEKRSRYGILLLNNLLMLLLNLEFNISISFLVQNWESIYHKQVIFIVCEPNIIFVIFECKINGLLKIQIFSESITMF